MRRLMAVLVAVALCAFAAMPLVMPPVQAQTANVTSAFSGGDLYFYDKSGNEIFHIDGTNRGVVYPSGSTLTTTSAINTFGAITATTVTASTHLNDASLTASRMVNSDASKNLVSNASVTSNALLKSVSSGASSAASNTTDDGTTTTIAGTAAVVSGTLGVTGVTTLTGGLVANGGIQGNFATKALTSGAAAVAFVTVTMPSNSYVTGVIRYDFEVTDATDYQAFGGEIPFNAVSKGATITCTVGVVTTATQAAVAASSGTLTNAITCADGGSGLLQLKATDTTSLTATVNRIRYRTLIMAPTTVVVTAQ